MSRSRLGVYAVLGLLLAGAIRIGVDGGVCAFADDVRVLCGGARRSVTVGYLPTTCDLTLPVASWTSAHRSRGPVFRGQRFPDYASMKEAVIAGKLKAGFLTVPLAMKLAADGVPVKIVCVAQHGGSELMVHRDSAARSFADLRGGIVAVATLSSCQNLLLHRLMEQNGFADEELRIVTMSALDMPVALSNGSIDAYCAGNPCAAKSQHEGWGRVLCYAGDAWPGFIACGLVVRQELIDTDRPLVQRLVDDVAASGRWLDEKPAHREQAAQVAGLYYFNQDVDLLSFVLSDPPDRITYSDLRPMRADFDTIMEQSARLGLVDRALAFEDYVDDSFVPDREDIERWPDRLPTEPPADKAHCR